jgi:hypothetical protein
MSPRITLALLAVLLTSVLGVAPAGAATGPTWLCSASALSASVGPNPTVEPVRAAPDRCANTSAGLPALPSSAGIPADALAAETLAASTTLTPPAASSAAQSAGATGRVERLKAQLPPGGAGLVLGVRAANAAATAACQGSTPALRGTSEAAGLSLNGNEAPVADILTQANAALAPFGQVLTIATNEQVRTATSLVQRAIHVRVLPAAGGAPVLDLIAGQATVGFDGSVCARDGVLGTGTDSGKTPQPCPAGTTYELAQNLCIIRQQVKGESDRVIIVGRPYQGPSGGTVITLTEARRRFGATRCLTGTGPAYAVIGTSHADNITGTNGRDRILTLAGNDHADGGRGDDCIDGGSGRDSLSGGLGNDRIFGMAGNDAVNGGPGSDHLSGGSGNDTLNAAFGRDVVLGGTGRDFINVATSGPAARVSCGPGRDKVRVNANERHRTTGCETRYVFQDRAGRK